MRLQPEDIQLLDVERIIRSRGGKWVPHFLIVFLKHLIHEDFLNTFLKEGFVGVDFCIGTLEYVGAKIKVEGIENLPKDGRCYTFVSNHPLGGVDGVALGSIIGQAYQGKIKYFVNDLLMNLKGLAPLCVPVNTIGHNSRQFPHIVDEAFQSDNQILMFPATLCSRLIDGKIQDLPWKKGFITKSIQTHRDVIPVHFIGQNSPRFYRVARLCKWLRIKFNLAMLLLPDELYHSKGKEYTVRIGKPIPWQFFDQSKTSTEWAQYVRSEAYKL